MDHGVKFTCTAGPMRMIDFAVVPIYPAGSVVSCTADSDTPWSPHACSDLVLLGEWWKATHRDLVRPRPLRPQKGGSSQVGT